MPFAPAPTPLQCPFCRAQITVPIRQIVDVGDEPALKNAVLSGRLNMFTCPACHNSGALTTPFFYHDPVKELAFVFLPMQLGLKDADQQRIIGQFSNALMSRLPPEKRKGYLLTPRQFFTQQSLIEAVLEADGVTKEMLEAQRAKLDLLREMAETKDNEAQQALIRQNAAKIDMTFFQLVGSALASAQASRDQEAMAQFTQLRNNLLDHTALGQRVKTQQAALEALQARPDRETLLEQLVSAQDAETREVLLTFGRPLLDYPFFQALTARIEKATAAGDKAEAERLVGLRREILALREKLDEATKSVLDERAALLREIVLSEDIDAAVRAHMEELDEAFLSVLDQNLQAAQQSGQQATLDRLQAVADAIGRVIQAAQPPEVRFVNALLSAPYPDETRKLLEANRRILVPQFVEWMRALSQDLREDSRADAADQLDKIIVQASELMQAAPAQPAAPSSAEPAPAEPARKPGIIMPGNEPPAQSKPQILIAKR